MDSNLDDVTEKLIPYGYKPEDGYFYVVEKNKYETFESWKECIFNEIKHRELFKGRRAICKLLNPYLMDIWNSITMDGIYPLRKLIWSTRNIEYKYSVWITYWNTDFIIMKNDEFSNYISIHSDDVFKKLTGHSYWISFDDAYSNDWMRKALFETTTVNGYRSYYRLYHKNLRTDTDLSPWFAPPASFLQAIRVYACFAVKHHPSKNKLPRELCQLIAEYII
jgi:hypothetical protein